MAETNKPVFLQKHTLTSRELAEIERLVAVCKAHEDLLVRLDYNLLADSSLPTDDLFLCSVGDHLVGCLLLDRYHSDMKEVVGMVHPDWRRQGIFTRLYTSAREECLSRGIRRLLFICEVTSIGGRAFLRSIRAGREFAEHRMVLRDFQPRLQYDDRLRLREALRDDLDELAVILAADFGGSQEKARQHMQHAFERSNQRISLASYGGEDGGRAEPVGTLRVEEMPSELGIYGFFVRPEYRGRGHGRQILEETIATVRASNRRPIMLEVDTNNFTALNLYRSLGFVIERTYEYYAVEMQPGTPRASGE